MQRLISHLIKEGYLKTPSLISAFYKIKREDFIREKDRGQAAINTPLSIGFSQTISQPLTVAFMLELLQPRKGEKILDIGSGSGWQTALLAEIVGLGGKVYAVERINELFEFGRNNVRRYNFIEKGVVEFYCRDGIDGLAEKAPFDKIICAASTEKLPQAWKEQLKINGRIVAPINESIWLFIKRGKAQFEEIEFPGFVFVPLIRGE